MKYYAVFMCLLILTACSATTSLSGIVDPNYKDNFQAKKILVLSSGMLIGEQKILENTLEKSLEKYDVQILRGLEILPPTRDYSDKDIYTTARNKGADTLLLLSVDRGVSESYIPPAYYPTTSTSYASEYDHFTTINTYTSPTFTTGGYNVKKPEMNISVNLKDIKNKETIWIAEGFSNGNAYTSFSDLTVSIAKTTVEELSNAGFFTEKDVPKLSKTSQE